VQAFALAGLGRLGSLAELLNLSALAASLAGEARSPEITRDHPRSPEITRDHPRSPVSLAGEAAALRASMEARMWDGNGTGRWCDGACSEVGWRSGVTTSARWAALRTCLTAVASRLQP